MARRARPSDYRRPFIPPDSGWVESSSLYGRLRLLLLAGFVGLSDSGVGHSQSSRIPLPPGSISTTGTEARTCNGGVPEDPRRRSTAHGTLGTWFLLWSACRGPVQLPWPTCSRPALLGSGDFGSAPSFTTSSFQPPSRLPQYRKRSCLQTPRNPKHRGPTQQRLITPPGCLPRGSTRHSRSNPCRRQGFNLRSGSKRASIG